jgi:methyl-accepting chemotaxis protein
MFGTLSFTRKLLMGIGLPVFLLVVIAWIGFNALTQTTSGFTEYRSLARETAILGRIQANLLLMDRYAQKYIDTGDKAILAEFLERSELTDSLFKDTQELVKNEKHLEYVKRAKNGLRPYNRAFDKIIEFREQRNELVLNQLDIAGPQIQRKLTAVMRSAEETNNSFAVYEAAQALRNLLLARIYVGKFLVSNLPERAKRVSAEFTEMEKNLTSLRGSLNDARQVVAVDEVLQMA